MIRIIWYTALVLATLTVLVVLWQFFSAVVLFLLSLALAAAFRPIIQNLIERGFAKSVALVLTFGVSLLVVGILIAAAGGQIIQDLQKLTDHLFVGYESLKINWQHQGSPLFKGVAEQLPDPEVLYETFTTEGLGSLFGQVQGIFDFFARMVIVVVLSFYWSIDHIRFERLWLSLLPVESRTRARNIWYALEEGVGAYIRREGSLSVISGVGLWLGYISLGVEYATLLAFVGSLVRLIPWLGAVLLVFLPLLAGSIYGWWAALAASVFTVMILILLEVGIGNTMFARSRYSSILLVIIVIMLAESYGLIGAVFAPILAVSLQILFKNTMKIYLKTEDPETAARYANLEAQMEQIKGMAATTQADPSSHVSNLASRLETLIQKSRSVRH